MLQSPGCWVSIATAPETARVEALLRFAPAGVRAARSQVATARGDQGRGQAQVASDPGVGLEGPDPASA
jgi:hypothetical protein